jgi:hypothetical protein
MLVKAKATSLEVVPKFVVFLEAEGFHGPSWTIQCEIIQQNMVGAQAGDEEDPNDDPPFDPPFDFFGLGQPANAA